MRHGDQRPARLATLLVGLALVGLPPVTATHTFSWSPTPLEMDDVSATVGLSLPVAKWDPSLGEPHSLLDLLPAGSPASGDFNNDGLYDLVVPAALYTDDALNALRGAKTRFFLNTLGATSLSTRFVDVTDLAGIDVQGPAYSAAFADYDGDGWNDLLIGGYRLAKLYHNGHDGTFTDVTAASGIPQAGLVMGVAWGDYDRDGALDVLLVQFTSYTHPDDGLPRADFRDVPGMANVLLRGHGDGTFTDVSSAAGIGAVARRSTSAVWLDATGDGLLDAYVTNLGEPAELWANQGDGTFQERAAAMGLDDGRAATCQAWEDFDRDGALDVFVPHQYATASLFLRQPDGTFTDAGPSANLTATPSGRAWGCAAFDHDGDADIDLFIAASEVEGAMAQPFQVYTSKLSEAHCTSGCAAYLTFRDDSAEAGNHDVPAFAANDNLATPRATSGVLALDWDFDGRDTTDLVTTSSGDFARVFLNSGWWSGWGGATGEFLKVQLVGAGGGRSAFGAVVTVSAGILNITRAVGSQMSWGGTALGDLYFGLWKEIEGHYQNQSFPVNVTVRWPDGTVDVWNTHIAFSQVVPGGFALDRMVRLREGGQAESDVFSPRPVLTLLSGAAGQNGWYTSPSVTLSLKAFDRPTGNTATSNVASLQYSLDGATWTSVANAGTGVTLPAFSGDGTHKLWVKARDGAGNEGFFLLPIRIDSTAPSGVQTAPAPGSVWFQGRPLLDPGDPGGLGRAVVVSPFPLAIGAAEPVAGLLNGLVGSDGAQPVAAAPSDATSGVRQVRFHVDYANGTATGQEATVPWYAAPYAWGWVTGSLPAGAYKVRSMVTDFAGLSSEVVTTVELVPTLPAGLLATVQQGPSLPG